jgi:hypothetical protein
MDVHELWGRCLRKVGLLRALRRWMGQSRTDGCRSQLGVSSVAEGMNSDPVHSSHLPVGVTRYAGGKSRVLGICKAGRAGTAGRGRKPACIVAATSAAYG